MDVPPPATPSTAFGTLMRQESSLEQFRANGLHEFRVHVDARGLLVVTLDASGLNGAAEWERVPVVDRGRSGDPNYVNNVEAQADF